MMGGFYIRLEIHLGQASFALFEVEAFKVRMNGIKFFLINPSTLMGQILDQRPGMRACRPKGQAGG